MKRVEFRKAGDNTVVKIIESPWLRINEAAAYCGVSPTSFTRRAAKLPYAGDEDLKLYHVKVLDQFVEGTFPDAPFSREQAVEERPKWRRRRSTGAASATAYINPTTGKVHMPRQPYPTTGGETP